MFSIAEHLNDFFDWISTQYRDSKEILGNMPQLYNKSMAFLKANLHNVQEEGASDKRRQQESRVE